ncbi:hypothetical protein BJ944DRAFT_128032 [Cunninghamella echinulata]|nr:hypothetical protein BJ944DRAFT_128032 [Cunninghamella echinulata]
MASQPSSPPPSTISNDTHYPTASVTPSTTERLHRDRSLSPHYSSRYNNTRYDRDIDRYRQDDRLSHHHHQIPPHLPPPPPLPLSSAPTSSSAHTHSSAPPPPPPNMHGLPPPPPPHHHHHHHHSHHSHHPPPHHHHYRRDYRDEGRFGHRDDRYNSRSHDRYGRYDDSRYDSRMRRSGGGDYRSYDRHHDDRRPYRYESKPRFRRPVNRGTEEDRQKSTIIFVGNLPYSFRERDVATMFERYGKIVKITIPIDNVTTKNKG